MIHRPKAADVARLAGVSRTTVSFVLNGLTEGNVSEATAARVREVAQRIGYTPDGLARSLRLQRTHVIGLVTDAIASSPFAGRLLGGAVDRAGRDGFVLVLFDSQDHPALEQEAVDELARRRVDGLLYATMGLRELDAPPATALPMVLANCVDVAGERVAAVPDDEAGGRAVAEHLADLGHRRIAMVSAPRSGPGGNPAAGLRERGVTAALAARGSTARIVVGDGWSIDDGFRAASALLDHPPADRPTAVFAVNDRVATGVLLAAARLGLDVPGELSVVGFDDQEHLAEHLVPALTTAALPHRAMGEFAADALLRTLAGRPPAPGITRLPCPLVVRASSGPPPA